MKVFLIITYLKKSLLTRLLNHEEKTILPIRRAADSASAVAVSFPLGLLKVLPITEKSLLSLIVEIKNHLTLGKNLHVLFEN